MKQQLKGYENTGRRTAESNGSTDRTGQEETSATSVLSFIYYFYVYTKYICRSMGNSANKKKKQRAKKSPLAYNDEHIQISSFRCFNW
jgi:hypothetical protein